MSHERFLRALQRAQDPNRISMHQLLIVDGESLRSVLRTVKEAKGTHRKAADWLGIEQSTFTRLLTGKTSRFITFATYSRIKRVLEEHDPGPFGEVGEPDPPFLGLVDELEQSVLTGDGQFVLENYRDWVNKEIQRLGPLVHRLFMVLWDDRGSEQFKEFLKRIGRRADLPPPEEKRIWLALYRAVEPLSAAELTWGVERSWGEIAEAGDLDSFLSAALKRERILLERERDLDRVKNPNRASLEEFKAWLAEDPTEGLPKEDWTMRSAGGSEHQNAPGRVQDNEDLVEGRTDDEGADR